MHDPAQLVEVNNKLLLFASAVEWSSYEFGSNDWQLQGDDIYPNGSPYLALWNLDWVDDWPLLNS